MNENDLIADWQKNKNYKSRDVVVFAHQNLLHFWLRKYPFLMFEYEDNIQHLQVCVLQALNAFNTEKNVKFSTYLTLWVRGELAKMHTKAQRLSDIDYCNELFDVPSNADDPAEIIENGQYIHTLCLLDSDINEKCEKELEKCLVR